MAKDKPEFPPLLSGGFHQKTLAELRTMCVVAFPVSTTRESIMAGLEAVCGEVFINGITGKFWIDGSFVTKKVDPADVDLVLEIDANVYEKWPPARRNWINQYFDGASKAALHKDKRVDGHLYLRCDKQHPLHVMSDHMDDYWTKQFGLSRKKEPKGIVILPL